MTVEINQIIKMILSIIPNHSLNTTHLTYVGVLAYAAQVYGLSIEVVASHHLIISVTIRSYLVYEIFTEVKYDAPTSIEITM